MSNKILITSWLLLFWFVGSAQEVKSIEHANIVLQGFAVGGYVKEGGYVTFGGPGIRMARKNHSFLLGMLPAIYFRKAENENDPSVVPAIGVGASYFIGRLVLQVPVFYVAKPSPSWNPGFGIGVKFN